MRFALAAFAVACWLGGGGVAPAAAQDAGANGLPPGEGREIVGALCSACHSLRLVTQQGMSRKRWADTLQWMVDKQGMPELQGEMKETVLDYLAEHYGERKRRGAGGVSPFSGVQPLQPAE